MIKTDTKKPVGVAIEEFYDGAYQAIYGEQQKNDKKEYDGINEQSVNQGEV